jgi:hypothetical protein
VRGYGCTSNAFTVLAVAVVDAMHAKIELEREVHANPSLNLKTSAGSPIGKYWIGALAGIRVASVFGAAVIVGADGREDTSHVHTAPVTGAQVIVVAHDARARVLSADAVDTNTGGAIEAAGRTIRFPIINTRGVAPAFGRIVTNFAITRCAIGLVVVTHDVRTGVFPFRCRLLTAPHHRNHAQRADTQESE